FSLAHFHAALRSLMLLHSFTCPGWMTDWMVFSPSSHDTMPTLAAPKASMSERICSVLPDELAPNSATLQVSENWSLTDSPPTDRYTPTRCPSQGQSAPLSTFPASSNPATRSRHTSPRSGTHGSSAC